MGGQPGATGGSDPITMFLPLIMIAFIFYFMIFRPQQKQRKEREAKLSKMEKGDKIITGSGIHGSIISIDDGTILVQVAEGVRLKFEKAAIVTIIPKNGEVAK